VANVVSNPSGVREMPPFTIWMSGLQTSAATPKEAALH